MTITPMNPDQLSKQIQECWNAIQGATLEEMPDSERHERILGFIGPAIEDLKAAKLLFADGLYASSVYHLQQATEKMTKAFLVNTNFLTAREIRDISHDSLRGYIKFLEKCSALTTVFAKNFPRLRANLKEIKELDKNMIIIANIEYKDIVQLLEAYDSFRKLIIDALKEKVPGILDSSDLPRTLKAAIGTAIPTLAIKEADITNRLDEYRSNPEVILEMWRIQLRIGFLYLMSSILFPHESFARYSHSEKGPLPLRPEDYTLDLGIVRAVPEIAIRLQPTFDDLAKYLG